ncbi:MAG: hypothetical protein HPY87_00100 [Fervidobacterium sp.]|uniref:SIR2 family protein n=1 Tax=Fervidobacterium sp. TaxID=1871331 RepID=UPI0025BF301A|nr:SIR2 family protein [Fervidobacterium sp.]NPU88336.1 hypothetical protein [Fervidobacterium sp.]
MECQGKEKVQAYKIVFKDDNTGNENTVKSQEENPNAEGKDKQSIVEKKRKPFLVPVDKENNTDDLCSIIRKFIFKGEENMIILTGAGSSILSKEQKLEAKEKGIKGGKTMSELLECVKCCLGIEKGKDTGEQQLNKERCCSKKKEKNSYRLPQQIMDLFNTDKNLEEILSIVTNYVKVNEQLSSATDEVEKCRKFIKEVKKLIKRECTLKYDKDVFKHGEFLSKILSVRSQKNERLKIFTANYDTLFEQAASKEKIIVIDGFSYTEPRSFEDSFFDYDFVVRDNVRKLAEPVLVDSVIHLYKLHGSIDWFYSREDDEANNSKGGHKDTNRIRVTKGGRNSNADTDDFVMIYPATAKFEQTFTHPFFELYSRFMAELKKKNTVLIVIGFSFGDEHIKNAIYNAMKQNRSLKLVIVDPCILDTKQKEGECENSNELASNFRFLENLYEHELSRVLLVQSTFADFVNILHGEDSST